jgi:GTP-binding protein HflX
MEDFERTEPEKAVLCGLNADLFTKEETATPKTLEELEALLETAGGVCVGKILQNRPAPDPHSFVGEGKADEIRQLVEQTGASMVVFDNDLSPSQIRALEDITGATVLDRSALILDIFAQRAQTREGRLQVELAQYQYLLPRLSGMGKSLSRQGGGIGTRGPGESKLETDRRHIRERITRLEAELEEVRRVRAVQRGRRVKNAVPVAALVGYTNAGKSTILNALTGAGIQANNRLFDTLDPTTRQLQVSDTCQVLLSDTVGFIAKLPHNLVSAFRATLEELQYADLLIHVIDASDSEYPAHMEVVNKLISELAREGAPVIECYNKTDAAPDFLPPRGEGRIAVSAKTGEGLDELLKLIERELSKTLRRAKILLPYAQGGLVDTLHAQASVLSCEYGENGIALEVIADEALLGRLKSCVLESAPV